MAEQVSTVAYGGPHGTSGGDNLKQAAAHGEPALEQTLGCICGLWRGAHAGVGFLKDSSPWGDHAPEQENSVRGNEQ